MYQSATLCFGARVHRYTICCCTSLLHFVATNGIMQCPSQTILCIREIWTLSGACFISNAAKSAHSALMCIQSTCSQTARILSLAHFNKLECRFPGEGNWTVCGIGSEAGTQRSLQRETPCDLTFPVLYHSNAGFLLKRGTAVQRRAIILSLRSVITEIIRDEILRS